MLQKQQKIEEQLRKERENREKQEQKALRKRSLFKKMFTNEKQNNKLSLATNDVDVDF